MHQWSGNCDVEPTGVPVRIAMRCPGIIEPMPHLRDTLLTRRVVLAGSAALMAALAGCSTGAPKPAPAPPKDPLENLLDAHVTLRTAYDDAIVAVPTDARLPALRGNVEQQISALAAALAIAPPSTPPAPSSSAPSAPATDAAALVTGLAQSESATSAQCRELAISQKAERAPLLASLAASHQAASVTLA